MSLSNAPGVWRWVHRSSGWWRVHDELRIEDGPYPDVRVCPRCGRATYNPADVRERYCGHCHDWTAPP